MARRAAVKEISRGRTGSPARRPRRAGEAIAAAVRAAARASSTAVTQAACSWATRAGECERNISPVDGPAPLIADLATFRQVSEPGPHPAVGADQRLRWVGLVGRAGR
jgi:hypothetical protein